MRVLYVVHDYLPNHPSGTEIYTAQLAKRMAERGHEVRVFTTEKDISRSNGQVVNRTWDGIEVEEWTNNLFYERFSETWEYASAEAALQAALERFRPDVVHFMHLLYLSASLPRIAREFGCVTTMTLHDFWLQCARFGQRLHPDGSVCHTIERERCGECLSRFKFAQTGLERRLAEGVAKVKQGIGVDVSSVLKRARDRMASPPDAPESFEPDRELARERADDLAQRESFLREECIPNVMRFFAPSRFLYDRFVEWGMPAEKIEHLTYGLDTEPFKALERTESELVRIAFLGTLAPHKGAHLVLRAWASLPQELRAAGTLEIYGPRSHNAGYVAELDELADAVELELAGGLRREEVPAMLARTDLLVVPSTWYENSPLTIHEAGAAGVALCVSDLGGMAELVTPGENGWRFRTGDVADLARVFAEALADRALVRARAGAAPKDMRESALEMEARYESLLARVRA